MISRSKVERIICLILNAVNILLDLFIIVTIVFKCLHGDFAAIVMGIYGIIMAGLLIINELQEIKYSIIYFYFLTTHRGRGFIMIFFGCLVLDVNIINIVAGTLVLATGLLYIILSFLSNFPQPQPLYVNWRNWNDISAEGLDLSRSRNNNTQPIVRNIVL
ncbi:hypothetical protein RMCBS344292_02026 [Rhizopus microsporus]|nr:hypothetical protein RMCBS344292_02026 [Rhizopus microsporus]